MSESDETPITGDILEEIVSRVPLIDLVSASGVSSIWHHAVSGSLRHLNPVKPWLIIHSQSTRSPTAVTTLAYDPRSHLWLQIHKPSVHYFSVLRSSHSSLLYMFSASRFVFSTDPLHLHWQETGARIEWRPDPIVAAVGNHVIVAGSACGIQDDLPQLEIYDTVTGARELCNSMPDEVMDSAASTWVSVAVDKHKMFLTLKNSGVTFSFDPRTKIWCGPYDLCPDRDVFFSVIGFAGDLLILVGLTGDAENVRSVIMWEVKKRENGERRYCEEISEMPWELVEKLRGESERLQTISMAATGDYVFIYNPVEAGELVVCELLQKGICRWESVGIAGSEDDNRLKRLVATCWNVSLGELCETFKLGNKELAIEVFS